jgi:hypothetical protein
MDNDYSIDISSILDIIDSAEVITFRFVTVQQRLLLDARCSEAEGPLLKLVPPAGSAEERFRSLKQLRPRFRLPEKITAVWWPKYVDSLVSTGVWDRVTQRMARSGFPGAAEQAANVLQELRQQERAEVLNAILGHGYQALWEKRR